MTQRARSASQLVIGLALGFQPARIVYAAAKTGLADAIGPSGAGAAELARALGVDERALFRLLRALAGLGLVHQGEDGRFTLTPLGETLRTDGPGSVRDYVIYVHEFLYDGFQGLAESVRTGEPQLERMLGLPLFEYFDANPAHGAIFRAGLGNKSRIDTGAVIDAYDFSAAGRLVDVGGGDGAFLAAALAAHPRLAGVLFDRPSVIEAARAGPAGALERCALVAGDFFESVPAGGDVYVLKRVLLDWSDEDAVRILARCRRAMTGAARLLIVESVIGPANEASPAHLFDMVMLVTTKGAVRSADELARLLETAGLRLERVIPTESELTVLEASVA